MLTVRVELHPAAQRQSKRAGVEEQGPADPEERLDPEAVHDERAEPQRQQAHRAPAHIEQGEHPAAHRFRNHTLDRAVVAAENFR
ncbi:MAG: hypothetical protein EXR61_03890 [Chloroflexi bacterium]|nr:hypothetical protein [Chloroflexota bacterium]